MSVQAICSVVMVGPMADAGGSINILLQESPPTTFFKGKQLWFYAAATMKREMLATALVAMTSGRRVSVDLGDSINPDVRAGDIAGTINVMYLT